MVTACTCIYSAAAMLLLSTYLLVDCTLQEALHPAARRAASLELVGNRYLLLHGGYAGTHQLLNDTRVFDTHGNRWLVVDVSGDFVASRAWN